MSRDSTISTIQQLEHSHLHSSPPQFTSYILLQLLGSGIASPYRQSKTTKRTQKEEQVATHHGLKSYTQALRPIRPNKSLPLRLQRPEPLNVGLLRHLYSIPRAPRIQHQCSPHRLPPNIHPLPTGHAIHRRPRNPPQSPRSRPRPSIHNSNASCQPSSAGLGHHGTLWRRDRRQQQHSAR